MIHVLATLEVAPGRRDDFLRIFNANVPNVLAEDGCLEYGPAVDVVSGLDVQSPPRENVVMVVEKWSSLETLKAHLAAPHMAAYREQVRDIFVSVDLQVLAPA